MMSLTVAQEAIGESYQGKLAVAYVIRNRAMRSGKSYTDVVLKPYQFSCWNTDSPTRMMLDTLSEKGFAECICASLNAAYQIVPDPTNGAIFYLNPLTVLGSAGKLPDWWSIDGDPTSEIKIGRHLFRRHRDDPGIERV
jgi:N-acetylmuramoyl-L-alanine amidase